ncbi:hypothetical protein KAFR_0D02520 [Kazachstania africana CBS 2517]|uniref:Autophagy-related protein 14 n=1 Tax=Kazachstania africana (strain ATCC 22294 / BCRC 22015 / CBS 2517 / CECT 1963 / NBRC 1671 / NRRL Y-8276) TaxID=1071382 RepID=H2AU49_KAZAF|nr:hypothetical protein KAFR_0D02520 [Kazachstania africana CBS 2517]CCF57899.1 hypothetical protein KAFR_0D02520 [Kazachstania africana CBS 2517]
MQCQICCTKKSQFYCNNCLNISPNLVLSKKFALIEIKNENEKLHFKINKILNFNQKNTTLLSSKFEKAAMLSSRRTNLKISCNIDLVAKRVQEKREKISQLKQKLECLKNKGELVEEVQERAHIRNEWEHKISQITSIVHKQRHAKLEMLRNWLLLRKRENSTELPYTISFQPIISVKNINKLPKFILSESISVIFKFFHIFSTFYLNLSLPYSLETKEDNLLDLCGKIVINSIYIARLFKQIPYRYSIDLRALLETYDIDGFFFSVMNFEKLDHLKLVKDEESNYTLNLKYTTRCILELLNGDAVQDSSQVIYDQDRWFVVK